MSAPLLPPLAESEVPASARATLSGLSRSLEGRLDFLRAVAHSVAALEALAAQVGATSEMRLPAQTREAIGLRVAELNRCDDCLAAQTARLDRLMVGAESIRRFRLGLSDDPKEQTLLALTTKLVVDRGRHTALALEAARSVGVSDEEIVEVVTLVGLNTFTNYLSSLADTGRSSPSGHRETE